MGTNPKSISIPFVVISPIFDCDVAKPEAEEAVAAVIKSFVFDIYADPSIVILLLKSPILIFPSLVVTNSGLIFFVCWSLIDYVRP
jgi:hypothetical protein